MIISVQQLGPWLWRWAVTIDDRKVAEGVAGNYLLATDHAYTASQAVIP